MNLPINSLKIKHYIENIMNYTLTTDGGYKLSFYLFECAEIFRLAFGGTITPILNEETHDSYVFNDENLKL